MAKKKIKYGDLDASKSASNKQPAIEQFVKSRKKKCDCYGNQCCDICQGVTGKGGKDKVAGRFLGGITKPKPYITIEELKKVGDALKESFSTSWYPEKSNHAIDCILKAAAKIARKREKK